jgi:hypothetical protein
MVGQTFLSAKAGKNACPTADSFRLQSGAEGESRDAFRNPHHPDAATPSNHGADIKATCE